MIRRSRIPALIALLIVFAAGIFFLRTATKDASAQAAELTRLQLIIARPDAKPGDWFEYARHLRDAEQYTRAVAAYQRVLEIDPYHHDARLQCACCYGLLGNPDDLLRFMKSSLLVDPKLTLNLYERPEIASFINDSRFKSLKNDAIAQSMD
jgi:tetratricopeptide (TPR) repeat protein